MDTTDPQIAFDADGQCNHCTAALERLALQIPEPAERDARLQVLVENVRAAGKGREYDCVIGVSGGCDSTMTAYHVKKLGLRPLAVHFDNGWNSELAVSNIKNTLERLKIDLFTHVVDWEEFRDLQMSFLRAGVPNAEIPTDHGITACLHSVAQREGIKYILSGSNLIGEAIMPKAWGHYNQDLRHLRAIHRRFGKGRLKTFPQITLVRFAFNIFVRRMRQVPFLNYVEYDKEAAKKVLAAELGWRDYGGKHYESVWTRFFQGHYLVQRFGFDKRRAHLSSLICAGQISRDSALSELKQPPYDPDLLREDTSFVAKKFGLNVEELQAIIALPGHLHEEFPGHFFLLIELERYKNVFRAIATKP
jgi:N-acetyl sugar amidotransferase